MITRNDNSLIIIAVVNTGVIFLILFYSWVDGIWAPGAIGEAFRKSPVL